MKKLLRASEVVVFLLALLGAPRLAVAADSGSWIPTGSMSVSRSDHTVTLLTDGNVLIVGGFTLTAELYDPIAATFTPTGNTLFFHGQGATATRLLDGRVLIVGGNAAQQSAEIYDPTTATFGATGTPTAPHAFHTATLLPNGKVLIAAGQDLSRASHAVAELYDPTTGNFMPTGSLNDHRFGQAATLLPNGKVLIAGGWAQNWAHPTHREAAGCRKKRGKYL